jgi:AraC-like DNA-binding protein
MSISSTLVQRADVRFVEAAEPLRSFVGCFWVMTTERDATIRLVPDGSTTISIQLEHDKGAEWFLRGPLLRPDERCFTSASTLVGIRLRPGVAFLVSGIPAHAMVDRRIAVSSIPACRNLVGQASPPTPERCIDLLQAFLLQRLAHAKLHDVVSAARDLIEREHGNVRAADVAARCGVSQRHLHRLMRTWIGYGPKVYATVIRFQATLHEMENAPSRTAAALASDNGYFDQAHLTLDVGRFAGATPGRLASTGVADFSKTRCDDLP